MPVTDAQTYLEDFPPAARRIIRQEASRHSAKVADVMGNRLCDPLPAARQAIWRRQVRELGWSRAQVARAWQRTWKAINVGIRRAEERRR